MRSRDWRSGEGGGGVVMGRTVGWLRFYTVAKSRVCHGENKVGNSLG